MRLFLLVFPFLILLTSSRNIRKQDDDNPFDVNTDLFSQSLSLSPPDDEDFDDLKVTTSRRFTGPFIDKLATALPPGYSPMPPGFNTEHERFMSEMKTMEQEAADLKEDRFLKAEMDSDREESDDKAAEEEQMPRVERNFSNELIVASSPELELFTSTKAYESDETNEVVLEGSGAAAIELRSTENVTEGSGKSAEDETSLLLRLPKVRVSGEVGMEEDSDGEEKPQSKRTNTVSVDTFLLPSLSLGNADEEEEDVSNRTEAVRGAIEGCPAPELCARNCFISLDEHGCQTCQCLWQAISCEKDTDCPESSQRCDLGKCDCSEGFIQDMTRSGMCKEFASDVLREDLSLQSLGVQKSPDEEQGVYSKQRLHKMNKVLQRPKRSAILREKPRRAERLEWPGSCDMASRCPQPLVCIRGDCWQLPDKPLRRKDSVPDSFVILSSDDNWEMENELQSKLFQQTNSKTLMRFVGQSGPMITREMVERTTMRSLDSHPNQLFEMRKSSLHAEEPQLAPSTVNGSEEAGFLQWPTMPSDTLAKAFTKMIELPQEQVLKPKPSSEMKKEKRRKEQTETTTAAIALDPIEFPISSQLESLRMDRISVEPPLALSVIPTEEEMASHDQFVKALEEQRKRVRGRNPSGPVTTAAPFPTLRLPEPFPVPLVLEAVRDPEPDEFVVNPLEEQRPGVWYTMRPSESHEMRRAPQLSTPRSTLLAPGTRIPVKVNGIVTEKIDDECATDGQCGKRYRCCRKRWCDTAGNCSTARFCLPYCASTKTINKEAGSIDIVED